jgi:hypothetical protein
MQATYRASAPPRFVAPSPSSAEPEITALDGFGRLRRAERLLVRACSSGDIAKISLRRPERSSAETSIRASLLAFIARGGLQLRGRRLQLMGAWIEGRLDLGDASIAGSLWFYRCRFDAAVLLDGARVAGSAVFAGCHLSGLMAEACTIAHDLTLNAGCVVDNDLRLSRAQVGGNLDCSRLDLRGSGEPGTPRRPLVADGLRVGGDVRLVDGFQAVGEVRFGGARIGGDLHASGQFNGNAVAEGRRGAALSLDRIMVQGSVRFDSSFGAAGCVAMRRARIGGDLDATGASFDWLGDASWEDSATLVLDRAHIRGALILRELRTPLLGASFVDARVGTLTDDRSTWGERLALDGFDYSRFGEGAPLDSVFRTGWLERQEPAHLKAQFRMQPWRRLIRVLRRMGHEHRAGSIALRRERWLRRVGWVGAWAPPALRWLPRAGHALLGLLAGHGYRPGRLVAWLAVVWLLCGGLYWAASESASSSHAAPATDSTLGPFAYSLDRLLPLVDLGQGTTWPAGPDWTHALRWVAYFESGFGWIAALLLLASIAGWVDRDRQR